MPRLSFRTTTHAATTALGLLIAISLPLAAFSACEIDQAGPQTSAAPDVGAPSATPTPIDAVGRSAAAGVVSGKDPVTVAAARQVATPSPTPDRNTFTVRVWWPDELYPAPGSPAEAVLLAQFDGFRNNYATYGLDVRRKRTNGLGGILPTLRTARPVAPGALPDISLMRYSDMITAASEGLIVPLDGLVSPNLVGDNLLGGARALGEAGGQLYGVPYVLNIYHAAYRASVFDGPLRTFADVLNAEPAYRFPAATDAGALVNWTLLVQYLAAGGRLVDENGAALLDAEPLLAVLDYYAAGREVGLFSPDLLEITSYDQAWIAFASAEANLVTVDSRTYLAQRDSVQNVALAPVPGQDAQPLTLLDGWVWVITTPDPDRQTQARAFLSWMMGADPHSQFTQAAGLLPSQERALRLWEDPQAEYAAFASDLLDDAVVVSGAQRSGLAAEMLQAAFVAVLEGTPPDEAAASALARLPISAE